MPIPDELRNQIAAQIMQSIFMPAQQPNFGELSLKRQAQAEENQYRQDALELTRRHTEFEEGQIPIARQAEADRQTQTLMMQKTLAEIAANTARHQTDVPVAAREPERIFMAGESEKDRIAADALAARADTLERDRMALAKEEAAAERDLKALLAKNALTSEERLLAKKLAAELEIANIDAILPKAQAKALEGEDLRLAAVKQAEIEKQTMMAPGIARELIEGAEPWAITRVFDQIMGGDTRGKFLRDLQEAIPGALDKAPKAALLPVINAELERRYGERYKRARDENKSAYSFLEQ